MPQLLSSQGKPLTTLLDNSTFTVASATTTGTVSTQSIQPAQALAPTSQQVVLLSPNAEAVLLQTLQAVGNSFIGIINAVLVPAVELVVYDYPDY